MANYVSNKEFWEIIVQIIMDATGIDRESAEIMYNAAPTFMPTIAAQHLFIMGETAETSERAKVLHDYLCTMDSRVDERWGANKKENYFSCYHS